MIRIFTFNNYLNFYIFMGNFQCFNSFALKSGALTISFLPPANTAISLCSSFPKGISTIRVNKTANMMVKPQSPTK